MIVATSFPMVRKYLIRLYSNSYPHDLGQSELMYFLLPSGGISNKYCSDFERVNLLGGLSVISRVPDLVKIDRLSTGNDPSNGYIFESIKYFHQRRFLAWGLASSFVSCQMYTDRSD